MLEMEDVVAADVMENWTELPATFQVPLTNVSH